MPPASAGVTEFQSSVMLDRSRIKSHRAPKRTRIWLRVVIGAVLSAVAAGAIVTTLAPSSDAATITVDEVIGVEQHANASKISTKNFSTPARPQLFVALISADGPDTAIQTIADVSGGNLPWTRASQANEQHGVAEIWYAWSANGVQNISITATLGNGQWHSFMLVGVFSGIDTAKPVGSMIAASGSAGTPAASLRASRPQSLIWGIGHDWDSAVPRRTGANQEIVHQFVDTQASATFWVQRRTAGASAAGHMLDLDAPGATRDQWNFAAIEVLPGPSTTRSAAPG